MGLYPGSSRREDNHARWEQNNPRQAITAKGKFAQGTRSAPRIRGRSKSDARREGGTHKR